MIESSQPLECRIDGDDYCIVYLRDNEEPKPYWRIDTQEHVLYIINTQNQLLTGLYIRQAKILYTGYER